MQGLFLFFCFSVMELVFLCLWMIVIILLLMWFASRFAGLESAMTNISMAKIAHMIQAKEPNANYVLELKKDMDKTLISILIGNNIVNILLASLAALFADMLFHTTGVTIVIIIITIITIVFCEIVPKSRGIIDDKLTCLKNAKKVYLLKKILSPLVIVFVYISSKVIKYWNSSSQGDLRLVGDENIKDLATLSAQEWGIKNIEKDIIHHVFYFWDEKVKDIMVPMKKVFTLDKNYTIVKAREMIVKHWFTRVPYVDSNGKVIGVLYSKDLLRSWYKTIKSLLRTTFFVSTKNDITEVFDMMKQNRLHMAIVQDHKKNHVWVVSLEDILEELVGEIYDEFYENKFSKPIVKNKKNK